MRLSLASAAITVVMCLTHCLFRRVPCGNDEFQLDPVSLRKPSVPKAEPLPNNVWYPACLRSWTNTVRSSFKLSRWSRCAQKIVNTAVCLFGTNASSSLLSSPEPEACSYPYLIQDLCIT
jgi:hypothetical protein